MDKTPKKFKSSPKRFHPKGMTFLYEDHDIIVIDKASGLLTMGYDKVKERTAYYGLNEYVRKGNSKSKARIFIVHRLDRDTSGTLVFAKSEPAKRYLMDEWKDFTKIYHAIVFGKPPKEHDIITSYLAEEEGFMMVSTDDKEKGKLAKTEYTVVESNDIYSLLKINLHTGKKNQIRVHLADIGCPVVGDKKYGDRQRSKGTQRLALHASTLSLKHPHTKGKMTFEAPLPRVFGTLMKHTPKKS